MANKSQRQQYGLKNVNTGAIMSVQNMAPSTARTKNWALRKMAEKGPAFIWVKLGPVTYEC